MVQAIISIQDETNRVLNMVKAKFGLKDKSAAIDMMALQYREEILEPQLRPEYVKKLSEIKKTGGKRFTSVQALRKHLEDA